MKDLLIGLIAHSETGVQTRLALALGVRVQTVNKWAKGHTAPDMTRWGQIEDFFGLEPGAFAAAAGVQVAELREADNLRARVTQLDAPRMAAWVRVSAVPVRFSPWCCTMTCVRPEGSLRKCTAGSLHALHDARKPLAWHSG